MKVTWFWRNWSWPTFYIIAREDGCFRGVDIGPVALETPLIQKPAVD